MFEQLSLFRLSPPPLASTPPKHLLIGARIVPYALRTSRTRLSMTIDERGLTVSAPCRTLTAVVEAFVGDHADWVLRKLDEYASHSTPRHLAIRDGTLLPLLGAQIEVRVIAGANRIRWEDDRLILAARPVADLDALARRALQRRALELFGERLSLLATRSGRAAPVLAISSARTRWGSCSAKTGIRLNWRLIHLPIELIDYVVAHEFAHLVEMNHGKRFWTEVERLCPDWRNARATLRQRGREIPLL